MAYAYFDDAGRVARTLTRIFTDALGLPTSFFDRFTGVSIDVLRMNNYALPPGHVDLGGDLTGMGETHRLRHRYPQLVQISPIRGCLCAKQVRGVAVAVIDSE